MKKSNLNITKSDKSNTLPFGHRIRKMEGNEREKFILEYQTFGVFFLSLWVIVKKRCLNVITDPLREPKADYKDSNGRGYFITSSDGECRSYDEAIEFFKYKPLNEYMVNEEGKIIYEAWANNKIARNFVSVGKEPDDIGKSRIGLFFPDLKDARFERKVDFWEEYFITRYKMKKII